MGKVTVRSSSNGVVRVRPTSTASKPAAARSANAGISTQGLSDSLGSVTGAVNSAVSSATSAASDLVGSITDQVNSAISSATSMVTDVAASAKNALGGTIDAITGTVSKIGDSVANISMDAGNLSSITDSAFKGLEETASKVKSLASDSAEAIATPVSFVSKTVNDVVDGAQDVFKEASSVMDEVTDSLELDQLGKSLSSMANGVSSAISSVTETVGGVVDSAKSTVSGVVDSVKGTVEEVRGTIDEATGAVRETIGTVKSTVNEARDTVRSTVNEVKTSVNDVKQAVRDVTTSFKNGVTQAKREIQEVKNSVIEPITSTVEEFKSDIKTGVNNVLDYYGSEVSDTVGELIDIGSEVQKGVQDVMDTVPDKWKGKLEKYNTNYAQDWVDGLVSDNKKTIDRLRTTLSKNGMDNETLNLLDKVAVGDYPALINKETHETVPVKKGASNEDRKNAQQAAREVCPNIRTVSELEKNLGAYKLNKDYFDIVLGYAAYKYYSDLLEEIRGSDEFKQYHDNRTDTILKEYYEQALKEGEIDTVYEIYKIVGISKLSVLTKTNSFVVYVSMTHTKPHVRKYNELAKAIGEPTKKYDPSIDGLIISYEDPPAKPAFEIPDFQTLDDEDEGDGNDSPDEGSSLDSFVYEEALPGIKVADSGALASIGVKNRNHILDTQLTGGSDLAKLSVASIMAYGYAS